MLVRCAQGKQGGPWSDKEVEERGGFLRFVTGGLAMAARWCRPHPGTLTRHGYGLESVTPSHQKRDVGVITPQDLRM